MLLTQCSLWPGLAGLDYPVWHPAALLSLAGMVKPLPGKDHSSPELEAPSGEWRQWDRGRPSRQLLSPHPCSPAWGGPANLAASRWPLPSFPCWRVGFGALQAWVRIPALPPSGHDTWAQWLPTVCLSFHFWSCSCSYIIALVSRAEELNCTELNMKPAHTKYSTVVSAFIIIAACGKSRSTCRSPFRPHKHQHVNSWHGIESSGGRRLPEGYSKNSLISTLGLKEFLIRTLVRLYQAGFLGSGTGPEHRRALRLVECSAVVP